MKPTPPQPIPDPTATATATARLNALEAKIGQSLAYRNFKNTTATLGYPIECDADLEAVQAAAAGFFKADVPLEDLDATFASHYAHSWQFYTTLLATSRLNWWDKAKEPPVVDVPSEDDGNGYFPDETGEKF